MGTQTIHYKVGNGDMMLVEMSSGWRLLVDINIREAAGTPDVADVAAQLRKPLPRDAHGRLYVDAFLLTHPDQDHCRGLLRHFHLGPVADWDAVEDKIVIREMWSSPVVFRRASKTHALCDDALAWNREARRRVREYRRLGFTLEGDRILILGEDVDGKTDDLAPIVVRTGTVFNRICGISDGSFSARLLAPIQPTDDDDEETMLSKNNSSVVLRLDLAADGVACAARYLIGGDAEVAIWERIWARNQAWPQVLEYDVLIAPHHCSWHSLSWDSWSDLGEEVEVSSDARDALGQARSGAMILASSKPIRDDDGDPPSTRARREYQDILEPVKGRFTCIADAPGLDPYVVEVTYAGAKPKRIAAAAILTGTATGLGAQPYPHG